MAWSGLLAELRPPADADYVRSFQRLADVHLELKQHGPSHPLLLQKSILEAGLGNYGASRRTAQDAVVMHAQDSESLYRLGVACLLLAYSEAGLVPSSTHEGERLGIRRLLLEARDALEKAAQANEVDEEAEHLRQRVAGLLEDHPEEERLVDALTGHMGPEGVSMRRPPRPMRDAGRP